MKNPTDFGKRVETGVDPCLPNCPLGDSPTNRLNVGTYDCESRTFFIMNFLNFLGESRRAGKLLFDDSNKTGMGFALKRDLFYFGFFFVATAEFRLGFGRSRDVLTLNNIDRNQRSLGRP